MTALQTRPPSDEQLAYLARLCDERGLPMPAPASMKEASLFISEILTREYHPTPAEWDRHDRTPADEDAEWLARVREENREVERG